jgi:hypothetical protein
VASRHGDEMTGNKNLGTMGQRPRCSEMRAMIGDNSATDVNHYFYMTFKMAPDQLS